MASAIGQDEKAHPSGYKVPGTGRGLLEVFRWRYLLKLLVRKETATRYRNSVLGWVWSYVRPAAQFLIFYVVLGFFLRFGDELENYALYLFSGIIVVNFFSEGFANATSSLVNNGHLVRKIYMPRELFPVAAVIVSFVRFLPQLGILVLVALLTGWLPLPLYLGAALLAILIIGLMAMGLGLFFGSLNVAFRDAQNFVELILLVATWASPVLYPIGRAAEVLPEKLFALYMVNPLTAAVQPFHLAFWAPVTDHVPDLPEHFWLSVWSALAISLATVLVGQLVFRKIEPRFAQDL